MSVIVLGARILGVVQVGTFLEALRTRIEDCLGLGARRGINKLVHQSTLLKRLTLYGLWHGFEGRSGAIELADFLELGLHAFLFLLLASGLGGEL